MSHYTVLPDSLHRSAAVPADCVLVAGCFLSFAHPETRKAYPSLDTLREALPTNYDGCLWSRRRIIKAITWLEKRDFFVAKRRRWNTSTMYTIRPERGPGSIDEWATSLKGSPVPAKTSEEAPPPAPPEEPATPPAETQAPSRLNRKQYTIITPEEQAHAEAVAKREVEMLAYYTEKYRDSNS